MVLVGFHGLETLRASLQAMANIDKRGGYTPRRVRERRAYRLVVTGGVAGTVGVVGAVLAIAGVISWGIPIIAFIVAAVSVAMFRAVVGAR
jgi:hypothetical protein